MMRYIIGAILFMLSFSMVEGQKLELVEQENKRSVPHQDRYVRFTPDTSDLYTISVIGPAGEKIYTPIKNQSINTRSPLEFKVDTKFWRRGTYFIIASNTRKNVATKRLVIK